MSPVDLDATILVTGINGHLGSTLVPRLLELGFTVRGTVRSVTKGAFMQTLLSTNPRYRGFTDRFELVEIPDFTSVDAYKRVMDGVSGVIHLASPNTMDQPLPETQAGPAVGGTLAILKAASQAVSVVRFTLIGTIGSIIMNDRRAGELTRPTDWNTVSQDACQNPEDPAVGFHCYLNSKMAAEKAAWAFVESEKPAFDFNVVLPSIALGPVYQPVTGPPRADVSLGNLWDYLEPRRSFVAPSVNVLWVHSLDVIDSLIQTLTASDAKHQRFICNGGKTSWAHVCDILRKAFPERNIPPLDPTAYVPQFPGAEDIEFDTSSTENILGIRWRSLEDAIVSAARDLVVREAYGWDKC